MNTYTIYLKGGTATVVNGHSYLIDKDKGFLYILNEKKWKIGLFFLDGICGFVVDFPFMDQLQEIIADDSKV